MATSVDQLGYHSRRAAAPADSTRTLGHLAALRAVLVDMRRSRVRLPARAVLRGVSRALVLLLVPYVQQGRLHRRQGRVLVFHARLGRIAPHQGSRQQQERAA